MACSGRKEETHNVLAGFSWHDGFSLFSPPPADKSQVAVAMGVIARVPSRQPALLVGLGEVSANSAAGQGILSVLFLEEWGRVLPNVPHAASVFCLFFFSFLQLVGTCYTLDLLGFDV